MRQSATAALGPLKPERHYSIRVPDTLLDELYEAVELIARRTGEETDDVRRGVEQTVLQRGIRALMSEEGKR